MTRCRLNSISSTCPAWETPLRPQSRFEEVWIGVSTLLVAFSDSSERVEVERSGGSILLTVAGVTHELDRAAAVELQESIQGALTERHEFFRTAGVHREDGTYVVERRNADSTGNQSVFETFDELQRLFDRLPETFDADAISRFGITGSRRHMIVRHMVEHPEFDCELASRNPLRGQKTGQTEQPSVPPSAMAD